MTQTQKPKPVVLCILDGWGERTPQDDNAISLASTPNWDRLAQQGPTSRLNASALEVGLPTGQMGNSEVGHMNLGAGRVVMQDLPRIDQAIEDGSLAKNPALKAHIKTLKKTGGTCHLMGLLSPGGVHSTQQHIAALAEYITHSGVPVAIHAFLDGRDTPPSSAKQFMLNFLGETAHLGNFGVATVSGRYYAMDRDNRWDRVSKAYTAMVDGQGEKASDAISAITQSYEKDVNDEFVLPTVVGNYGGMKDGDGLLMANFRADRAREILAALANPGFDGFERSKEVKFATRLGMVEYSKDHNTYLETLFDSVQLENILGQIIADKGMKQLRIAETEKYAHVTFFFNGGEEKVFPGEERILIPSPNVATYDLKPDMSAGEVTEKLVDAIKGDTFDLIVVNYANGDMVGHTGFLGAAQIAAQTVDKALGQLEQAVIKAGGTMFITADHGNLEQMKDPETGQPHTAHTLNPVPAILVNAPEGVTGLKEGRLADVAPTLLQLLNIEKPSEMTGESLLKG
ncbi:MAG: 2,3-bisphosphoglycerate-independent phosphoglycerate mutase [Alphaproteobacteria bacterium]|nr:2,3-bisphosphoglycerate-independent phosphoglycerate mutase [Alphaproteobacteria bacterium]